MGLLLTCGMRPFKTTPEIFVTDHSGIALQESKQVVRSCCIRQYYTVVYAPIRRVIGTHFEVGTFGQDTFKSRMFAGTCIGDLLCPIASYVVCVCVCMPCYSLNPSTHSPDRKSTRLNSSH